ncbi:MAG: hypothetical protein GY755_24330 [Chloroflexi bacterium]|nr:hypothetical protein [Chloroflexota bacterium]
MTLGTSLRKYFSFLSKSKMAAAAITANYEFAHNLKSIQLRDPIFSSHWRALGTALSQEEEKEKGKVEDPAKLMFLQ